MNMNQILSTVLVSATLIIMMAAHRPAKAEEHEFVFKMKSAGVRWSQGVNNLGTFWGVRDNRNGIRIFGTTYVSSKRHQVKFAYQQKNISAPWDMFTAGANTSVILEYQYNFK